ncbi:MAG: hypothetical protein JXB07_20640 [Anaerolineae bacterium]|nr:hypothetical protein [Anaerolineae bacterium]
MWLLLPIIPIVLILTMFLVAHRQERELPAIERRVSLSLWVGLLSLVPGLMYARHLQGGSLLAFSFENATEVRGWPLPWWGYQGVFSLLWVPLALLADMGLVAVIALICFGLAGVLKRRIPWWTSKASSVYPLLAIVLVFFPLYGALSAELYNTLQEEGSHRQYVAWVERNAETVIGSIQLEQCNGFALVPSREHPGTMNIQVSVTARVNESHVFELSAHIQETRGNRVTSIVKGSLKQQLPAGEHLLEFIIHPVDVDSDYVRVDKPGPYEILVIANRISVADGGYGGFFEWEEFVYAYDNLGISGENLRLECQSPPYTLADLGLPISPTSQP